MQISVNISLGAIEDPPGMTPDEIAEAVFKAVGADPNKDSCTSIITRAAPIGSAGVPPTQLFAPEVESSVLNLIEPSLSSE